MNKRIGLFLCVVIIALASCKSKKGVSVKKPETKVKSKELQVLSEKLNLEVEKSDNIKLYQYVANWIGTPHKLGSCTKSAIDCSCFIQQLFQEVYQYKLPRTAAEMHKASKKIDEANLHEGDLVFFKINATKVSHVGVYLKNGWFAHVSTTKGVMINNLSEPYYQKHFTSFGRTI